MKPRTHSLILYPARYVVPRDLHGPGGPLLAGTVVMLERVGPGPYATVSSNGHYWCVAFADLAEVAHG